MAEENKGKQTYKYKIADSILGTSRDDYELSRDEYFKLYSFYVTYSMCPGQSDKSRDFLSYGWQSNKTSEAKLSEALKSVVDLHKNANFIFTEKNDLKDRFADLTLTDGPVADLSFERSVVGSTTAVSGNYLKLFYRIRDCLAHGKFKLRLNDSGQKFVVMQDNSKYNVTARIVIKLDTLLGFVSVVDSAGLIG